MGMQKTVYEILIKIVLHIINSGKRSSKHEKILRSHDLSIDRTYERNNIWQNVLQELWSENTEPAPARVNDATF